MAVAAGIEESLVATQMEVLTLHSELYYATTVGCLDNQVFKEW